MTAAELALGLAGFHFAFAVVRAVAYLAMAGFALDADLSEADWLGFVVMMAATGIAMSAIGIALTAAVVVFKRAELLSAVVLLAVPARWRVFPGRRPSRLGATTAEIMPTTFAFSGVRNALYTGDDWGSPLELIAFALVALPVGSPDLPAGPRPCAPPRLAVDALTASRGVTPPGRNYPSGRMGEAAESPRAPWSPRPTSAWTP